MLAARVVAVAAMVGGADFTEVFRRLTVEHGIDHERAFDICVRVFRGGGFTKDWVYVAEVERIVRYLAEGGEPGTLVLGKVTMDALEAVEDLLARSLLRPARFLPLFLEDIGSALSNMRVVDFDPVSVTLRDLLLGRVLSPR